MAMYQYQSFVKNRKLLKDINHKSKLQSQQYQYKHGRCQGFMKYVSSQSLKKAKEISCHLNKSCFKTALFPRDQDFINRCSDCYYTLCFDCMQSNCTLKHVSKSGHVSTIASSSSSRTEQSEISSDNLTSSRFELTQCGKTQVKICSVDNNELADSRIFLDDNACTKDEFVPFIAMNVNMFYENVQTIADSDKADIIQGCVGAVFTDYFEMPLFRLRKHVNEDLTLSQQMSNSNCLFKNIQQRDLFVTKLKEDVRMNCCQVLIELALYMSNNNFRDLVWIESNENVQGYVTELYEEKRFYEDEAFSLYGFNQHNYLYSVMAKHKTVHCPSPQQSYAIDGLEEDYKIQRWEAYVSCMSSCSRVLEQVKWQYRTTWNPSMAAMFVEMERALSIFIYNFGLPFYKDETNSATNTNSVAVWNRLITLNELSTMLHIVSNSNAKLIFADRCWSRIHRFYSRAMNKERDAMAGMHVGIKTKNVFVVKMSCLVLIMFGMLHCTHICTFTLLYALSLSCMQHT